MAGGRGANRRLRVRGGVRVATSIKTHQEIHAEVVWCGVV